MMGTRGQQKEEGQGRAGRTLAGYLFTGAGNHSKIQRLGAGPKELRGLSNQRIQDRERFQFKKRRGAVSPGLLSWRLPSGH